MYQSIYCKPQCNTHVHKEQQLLKAIQLSQIKVIALWVRHQRLSKQVFVKQEEQKTAGALFDFWQMKAMLNGRETLGHNEFVAMAMSFFRQ
jgi:hypothetical protein